MENNNDYLEQAAGDTKENNTENVEKENSEETVKDLVLEDIPENQDKNISVQTSNTTLLELLELNDVELETFKKFLNNDNRKESLIINLDSPDYNSDEYKMLQTRYIENLINFYIIEYLNKNEKIDFEDLQSYLSNIHFPDVYQINETDIYQRIDDITSNPNYKNIENLKKLFQLLNKKFLIKKYIEELSEHEKTNNIIKNILSKILGTIGKIRKENEKLALLHNAANSKEKEIVELKNEMAKLEDANEAAEQELAELRNSSNNNSNNEKLLQELEDLKKTKISLEEQLKTYKEELENSDSGNDVELENELENLKEKQTKAEERISKLQEELHKKDEELESIKEAKIAFKKEIAQLQEDLEKQNNSDTDTDVKLLREELDELKRTKTNLEKELSEVKNNLSKNTSNNEDETVEENEKESEEHDNKDDEQNVEKKDEKEVKKPKSGNKIVKYMLYGLGGFLGLIVLWFVYAFAFAPAKDNSLSTAVQKVKPQQKTKNKQVKKEEKKPYDFTKKLTEKEFKKQKFDIYPNNEFACRVNGKRFEANDIINGWMFRKTVPSWKKLIFTDPAETKSFSVDMVDE